MFPESYVAAEFWDFVQQRACDTRNRGEYNFGPGLDQLDQDRKKYLEKQSDPDFRCPIVYTTIQQALIDFLIYFVNYSGYTLTYEVWLRTVTLVMAQALRQPRLLTVQTPINVEPPTRFDEQQVRPHTMQVAEHDWDCLSRDSYDYVVRTFPYGETTSVIAGK